MKIRTFPVAAICRASTRCALVIVFFITTCGAAFGQLTQDEVNRYTLLNSRLEQITPEIIRLSAYADGTPEKKQMIEYCRDAIPSLEEMITLLQKVQPTTAKDEEGLRQTISALRSTIFGYKRAIVDDAMGGPITNTPTPATQSTEDATAPSGASDLLRQMQSYFPKLTITVSMVYKNYGAFSEMFQMLRRVQASTEALTNLGIMIGDGTNVVNGTIEQSDMDNLVRYVLDPEKQKEMRPRLIVKYGEW